MFEINCKRIFAMLFTAFKSTFGSRFY